jgi:hypothetical protein
MGDQPTIAHFHYKTTLQRIFMPTFSTATIPLERKLNPTPALLNKAAESFEVIF